MTTNDNLRGLLRDERTYGNARVSCQAGAVERCVCHMCRAYRIDAALAAPDSGEVVLPERASLSNVDVILGALGMYGRVDFGQAVAIYNQALDDVAALNKEPAKAEPERQRDHEVIALINALGDKLIDDKEASTDE